MEFPRNEGKNRRHYAREPRNRNPSGAEHAEPICEVPGSPREGQRGITDGLGGRGQSGLDPEQAIEQWLKFAKGTGYVRVAGQRSFDTDIALIDTMREEAESLFCFARSIGLGLAESLPEIIDRALPLKAGNEHKVLKIGKEGTARVIKITHPGKYGRIEHTPYLYLERWALLNRLTPSIRARFEDCFKTESGEVSIVTSMTFFTGKHPGARETDNFIKTGLGFDPLHDGSATLDYISADGQLILRDCHPKNWIRTKRTLVPIDIIPQVVIRQH